MLPTLKHFWKLCNNSLHYHRRTVRIVPENAPYLSYIRFSIEDFIMEEGDYSINISEPPVSEMNFLQLPVRNRKYFGEWLNVSWDDQLAINVLGTDHYARIDSEKREGFRILMAGVEKDVKLRGVGAALIVCKTEDLLGNIARVEEDFNLPMITG